MLASVFRTHPHRRPGDPLERYQQRAAIRRPAARTVPRPGPFEPGRFVAEPFDLYPTSRGQAACKPRAGRLFFTTGPKACAALQMDCKQVCGPPVIRSRRISTRPLRPHRCRWRPADIRHQALMRLLGPRQLILTRRWAVAPHLRLLALI